MKKLYLTFVLLVCIFNSFGQQSKIDSLKTEFNQSSIDSEKGKLLIEILNESRDVNSKDFNEYLDSLNSHFNKTKTDLYQAQYHRYLGLQFFNKGDYVNSLNEFKLANSIFLKEKDSTNVFRVYSDIGASYKKSNQIDSALFYYKKVISLCDKSQKTDFTEIGYLTNYRLGILYNSIGDVDNSIKQFEASLLKAEQLNKKSVTAKPLYMLGTIYKDFGNYKKAKKLLNEALIQFEEMGNFAFQGAANNNIGNILNKEDSLTEALKYYKKAILYLKKGGRENATPTLYNNIGSQYSRKGKYNIALKYLDSAEVIALKTNNKKELIILNQNKANIEIANKNFKTAIIYLKRAEKASKKKKSILSLKNIYTNIAACYEKLNDYENAYHYSGKLIIVKDSIFKSKSIKHLNEIETKYQTEKKENELAKQKIAIQEQELLTQKANNRNWLLTLGLLALSISAFFIWRRYKSEAKAKQIISEQKVQIEKLQKEFHHRIKNDFRSINSFIRLAQKKFPETKFQERLNELKNRVTSMFKVHELLLQQDNITHVKAKSYLTELSENVKQKYNNEHIKINCNVDASEVIIADKSVPFGVILNEFVTNSYKHAFNENGGTISINFHSDVNNHYLTLNDNGKGLPLDFDASNLRSFGLEIMPLLAEQYDGQFKLESNNGVCVTVTLPKQIA